MRRLGVAGTALGVASLAGCSEGDGPETEREVQTDLPQERQVEQGLVDLVNTERYDPQRYQVSVFVTERIRESIGLDIREEPVEIGTQVDRFIAGDFQFVTFNWSTGDGDPDSVLYNRFHSEGSLNAQGFNHEGYDEVALKQRSETDTDARQQLVHECQRILGEQRPENCLMHDKFVKAFNSDRIEPDSVVVDPLQDGLGSVWNWVSMVPRNDEGRTLVTNNWDPTDQLNPFHANARGPSRNNLPTTLLHDFLVRVNPESAKPEPWAAESVEPVDDVTTVVTVRDDMVFHDGEPLTLDDVLWSYETVLETAPPAYESFVSPVDSIEQTGEWEITFHLTNPYVPFVVQTLNQVPILPRHYWEQILADAGAEDEPWTVTIDDDTPAIGSGPFQWGSWDQGERFTMPAFVDHPFASPNIDMRIQRPLDTREAELRALVQGDYDLLDYWLGDRANLQETADNEDHLSAVTHGNDGRMIELINCAKPPFDDPVLRQATNAVVMAAQPVIIEEIYNGYGEKAISPIPPSLEFWHNPDTPFFGPGEDVAVEILEEAGYVWDEEGNLYYPE